MNQDANAMKTILFPLILVVTALCCGCGQTSSQEKSSVAANTSSGKVYDLRGVIVSVDAANGKVQLTNENIPGFMEPMTMTYSLANPMEVSELHAGDKIRAQLTVNDASATLSQIDILQQSQLDYKPTTQYHTPQAGDPVPDFTLTNQSGHRIHLGQYHGKVLLVTFIYTRCPLSDYCPRMSRNFAAVDKMLAANPRLYAKTHLLSISFDPGYDTPAVLRSYGEAYTERFTQEKFQHWEFAAPNPKELAALLQWFDVGLTPGPGKTLAHSLSTVVIGPDGKVRAWYPTNEWTPEQILHDAQRALLPMTEKAQRK